MKDGIPVYDYDLCVACGICTFACPVECIALAKANIGQYKTKLYPQLEDKEACTSCGICEKDCPIDAVVVQ